MPCIVLDILERLSRLTNGFALVGERLCCGKEHWQDRVGGRRKERAGGVFQVFYFLKIPS